MSKMSKRIEERAVMVKVIKADKVMKKNIKKDLVRISKISDENANYDAVVELSVNYTLDGLKYLREQYSYDKSLMNVISGMMIEKMNG